MKLVEPRDNAYTRLTARFQAYREDWSSFAAAFGEYLTLPSESKTLQDAMQVAHGIDNVLSKVQSLHESEEVFLEHFAERLRRDVMILGELPGKR